MQKLIFFHTYMGARYASPFKGKKPVDVLGYGKTVKPRTVDPKTVPDKLFGIGNSMMEPMSNEWIADELNMSSIRQPEVTRLIHENVDESRMIDWVSEEDDGSCEDGFPMRKFVDAYFFSKDDCDRVVSILNQKFTAMAKRLAKRENKTLAQVAKELGAEIED